MIFIVSAENRHHPAPETRFCVHKLPYEARESHLHAVDSIAGMAASCFDRSLAGH